MLSLRVSHSPVLEKHLSTFEVDGTTVEGALFSDGRLMYPGRQGLEQIMHAAEPYTLWHEARVVEGFFGSINQAIWLLAEQATEVPDLDPTLEVLWRSHAAARGIGLAASPLAPSLDRLVAALVTVQRLSELAEPERALADAAIVFVRGLTAAGFPASAAALEEIWDGAAPACVGLVLVDIG